MGYYSRNLSLIEGIIVECERCGSVVWNTVAHDKDHQRTDDAIAAARSND